jgi:glycosyltransferase involved in cell wall biosynthesis
MSKIRLLYCQETVGSGGVEQRKLSAARYFAQGNYELKLVCSDARASMVAKFEEVGAEVIIIGKQKNIFSLSGYVKLLQIIRTYKPHIIHGAVFGGVALACIAGFLGRVPIIIAEETSDPQNRSSRASKLLRMLVSLADKVIAIAPSVADYLKQTAHIPFQKIQLINNGVEIPRVVAKDELARIKFDLGIAENDLVIGSVGRLFDDHKKFTDLIKAVAALPQRNNIKLLIVGDGKDKQLILETAANLGISDILCMAGYQPDTAPYYAIMDIFCLASQREGFGLVAAEAMLHKLPVVATAVGGLKDVVTKGETGYLVPPLQPSALAEKIQQLLGDENLRNELGNAGYQKAIREYTAEVYVKKVESLYRQLMASKGVKAN